MFRYLPAFKRSIIDADAWSVMSAYHSYDGVPAAADYHLLTEILRDEWGYKYHVTTDVKSPPFPLHYKDYTNFQ